ncbi:IclR family transcriptional regulator [Amycolatopsis jejuensis]|uniref:IclR family transcriptional regulator n=1 Tax=Amycolatopsis jejuensis TaxID=330084 RepID=UPI000525E6C9|nr:IclR family transcriptional regulator [Amycolatopsis jejuensis]
MTAGSAPGQEDDQSGRQGAPRGGGTASTLRRGIAVLEALTRRTVDLSRGLGSTEVAKIVGCDKSQASRTLWALVELGLVERAPEGRGFRPTWALYGLGVRAADIQLVRLSSPVLSRLSAKLECAAFLTVRDGTRVLAIWGEGLDAKKFAEAGTRWTVYASAAGQALLVDYSKAELASLLHDVTLERFTAHTPQTLDDVWRRIGECRRLGYAVSDREWDDHLTAVAVPVRGSFGDVIAAIAVAGSSEQLGPKVQLAAALCEQACDYLSGQIRRASGHQPARPDEPHLPRWLSRLP